MATHRFTREELTEARPPAFTWRYKVRIQDIDAAGIVFFARYLEIFHDGLFAFLDHREVDLVAMLAQAEELAPVRHAELDYFRPLRYGDEVEIAPVLVHLEETQASIGFRMQLVPGGELVALCQLVHVAVDGTTFERIHMPESLVAAFSPLRP